MAQGLTRNSCYWRSVVKKYQIKARSFLEENHVIAMWHGFCLSFEMAKQLIVGFLIKISNN
ncbi:hypothetical protein QQ41_05730 [Streptococcus equi subsp. zooepidemicus]|nr:hypothetical protein QQ41_05730 [Streptococcus equi subsp. zooepidemicus]